MPHGRGPPRPVPLDPSIFEQNERPVLKAEPDPPRPVCKCRITSITSRNRHTVDPLPTIVAERVDSCALRSSPNHTVPILGDFESLANLRCWIRWQADHARPGPICNPRLDMIEKTDSLPPESAIRPAIGIEVALPSGYAGDSTRALDVKRMLNAVYPNASSVSGRNGWLNQRKRKNDRHNFALVEAVQSIICTDPDVSFMVFQKCGDRVVRKPVGRREAFHSR